MRAILALLVVASCCLYQVSAQPPFPPGPPPFGPPGSGHDGPPPLYFCGDGNRAECRCGEEEEAPLCHDEDEMDLPPPLRKKNCDPDHPPSPRCTDGTEPELKPLIECEDGGQVESCTCESNEEISCMKYLPRPFHRDTSDDRLSPKKLMGDLFRLFNSKRRLQCDPSEFNVRCGDGQSPKVYAPLPRPRCGHGKDSEEAACTCRTTGVACYTEERRRPYACLPFEFELTCENGEEPVVIGPPRKPPRRGN